MRLTKGTDFKIAKSKRPKANTILEPLDYERWIKFVDNHQDVFIWRENTDEGKEILKNINEVPVDFRERVLGSLNKRGCFNEYDNRRNAYNIYVGFYEDLNYIRIQFARTPKLEDLRIFIEMAENLDAHLLVNDKKIITREDLENGEIV